MICTAIGIYCYFEPYFAPSTMTPPFRLFLLAACTILLAFISLDKPRRSRRLTSYNFSLRDPKTVQLKSSIPPPHSNTAFRHSFDQVDDQKELSIRDQILGMQGKVDGSKELLVDPEKTDFDPKINAEIAPAFGSENIEAAPSTKENLVVMQQQQETDTASLSSISQEESLDMKQGQIEVQQKFASPTNPQVTEAPSDSSLPSYIQLCKELIKRRENPEKVLNIFIVRESSDICRSNDSFRSLLTIMASTMIAQAAGFLRLQYQPTCEPSDINEATIQQLLPQDIFLGMCAGVEVVSDICKVCLEGDGTLECLGLPIVGVNDPPVNPVKVSNRILSFRHNVQWAVKEARRMENAAGLPTASSGGAVIYLDLESSEHPSMSMPLSWYAERIPVSVSSIIVLVHQQCVICVEHGQMIVTFLREMYPRATIHFEVLGSTALVYTRIMTAPYLLCPPTSACLLPSFMRDVSHKTFIGDSPALFSWFRFAVRTAITTFHIQVEVTGAEMVLARPVHNMAELQPFLVKQPSGSSKTCEALRGRLGKWEYNTEYGVVAQYFTPLERFQDFPDFIPSIQVPFRPSTMYKWVDTMCPVDLMTMEGFCGVMKELALTRIYLVGDSLQLQMAMSLWKLLGNSDDPVERPKGQPLRQWMSNNWARIVDCNGYEIDFVFTRNDLIDNNTDMNYKVDKDGYVFNCGIADYCLPWIVNYADYNEGGTLLIANAGSHLHDVDAFPVVLQSFFSMMDLNQKESDIVMLRTTVPGHENCQEPNVKPYESHAEFESELVADSHSWHLYSEFNDQCKCNFFKQF